MNRHLCLSLVLLSLATVSTAQDIPKELWGTWRISRVLPADTISCWGDADARAIIGTKIGYTARSIQWKGKVISPFETDVAIVGARQFHDENSGFGPTGSQVTFQQLGIKAASVKQVTLTHRDANIAEGTPEMPGDNVLIRDRNTIIFSVCNVYFTADRVLLTNPVNKRP